MGLCSACLFYVLCERLCHVMMMDLVPSLQWVACVLGTLVGWLVGWFGWVVVGCWLMGGWVALYISQSISKVSVLLMVNGWETGTGRRAGGTDWSKTHALWFSWYLSAYLPGEVHVHVLLWHTRKMEVVGCGFGCSLDISYVLARPVSQPVSQFSSFTPSPTDGYHRLPPLAA